MSNKGAEQKWWTALSSWLIKYQGRADYLFIYDGKHGRLDRCFDRNVSLHSVDEATVSKLYQAAAEGRLGLLRPKDLKPQLLTTDPAKMFSSGKEVYLQKNRPQQAETEENAVEEMTSGADERKTEQAAADPAVSKHLQEATAGHRQAVQGLQKTAASAPTGTADNKKAALSRDEKEAVLGAAEQAAKSLQNAAAVQQDEESGRELMQLAAELVQYLQSVSEAERADADLVERKRKEREKFIAAQDIFIWSAVSEKRDREELEAQLEWLEWLEGVDVGPIYLDREWKEQAKDVSRELYKMDKAGASEQECGEKIRDYLEGKKPVDKPRSAGAEGEMQEDEPEISGEMWGNTLRHFCRFAASEVPLSVKHVQVAEHCQKILQQAKESGFSMDDLGLDPQEQSMIRGTIEMGKLVGHGLRARAALTSGEPLPHARYRTYLQNYLAMKGIEETLIPHVQAHEKEISTGDGPVSALQILMGNRGFRAADLRAKAGRSDVLARLSRMNPARVKQMIRQDGSELAEMGRQVMIASCQMEQPVREPKVPQKGGPQR